MILLLGATGYIGQAFGRELRRRGQSFVPLAREALDYTQFNLLFDYVRQLRPSFLINAAGYAAQPGDNDTCCDLDRLEALQANTLLPQTISRVCAMTNTPWGHVSSACIYSGAKIATNGKLRIVKDLNQPEIRRRLETHPEVFLGFSELDEPNYSFRHPPCDFLAGTKVLAEEALRDGTNLYIWRPGLLFDEHDGPDNALSGWRKQPRFTDRVPPLSHLDEFVRACLDVWEHDTPFGIYNIVNPGCVRTREIMDLIERLLPDHGFELSDADDDLHATGGDSPRCSCLLDVSKLRRVGVRLRPAAEALQDSLDNWRPAAPSLRFVEPSHVTLQLVG